MLKLDIATRIHQEAGIPMDEAAQLLEWFHGFLKTTLLAHKPIVIAGFGKFTVRNKHARPGTESSNGRSCDDLGAPSGDFSRKSPVQNAREFSFGR